MFGMFRGCGCVGIALVVIVAFCLTSMYGPELIHSALNFVQDKVEPGLAGPIFGLLRPHWDNVVGWIEVQLDDNTDSSGDNNNANPPPSMPAPPLEILSRFPSAVCLLQTKGGTNLRSKDSTESEAITTLPAGAFVGATAKTKTTDGPFWYVTAGYVAKDELTMTTAYIRSDTVDTIICGALPEIEP